jgi:hypothetical protein
MRRGVGSASQNPTFCTSAHDPRRDCWQGWSRQGGFELAAQTPRPVVLRVRMQDEVAVDAPDVVGFRVGGQCVAGVVGTDFADPLVVLVLVVDQPSRLRRYPPVWATGGRDCRVRYRIWPMAAGSGASGQVRGLSSRCGSVVKAPSSAGTGNRVLTRQSCSPTCQK